MNKVSVSDSTGLGLGKVGLGLGLGLGLGWTGLGLGLEGLDYMTGTGRLLGMHDSQGPRVPKTISRENHLPKAIFLFECYQ